eukprot:8095345-Pyramimonas_sp.AAC.3
MLSPLGLWFRNTQVSTYGTLANELGSSARAVGQALKRNPFAPGVPCHRVVGASLELGGFHGSWGAETSHGKRKKVHTPLINNATLSNHLGQFA